MNLLIFIATTLDPRYELSSYTKLAIWKMFGEAKGQKVWDAVRQCLHDLFEEYRSIYDPGEDSTTEVNEDQTKKRGGRLMRTLIAKKMRIGSASMSTTKSEFEKYLSEDNEDDSKSFDILAWWKLNESRFPIVSRLAHDVLTIPISTMSSESVFSTGGRVLHDFRTSNAIHIHAPSYYLYTRLVAAINSYKYRGRCGGASKIRRRQACLLCCYVFNHL
jgi:hypothetical protein